MGNTYFSRCSCGFLCFQFYFRRMVLKFQNMKRSPFHKGVRQTNVVVLTFVFMQVFDHLRDIFCCSLVEFIETSNIGEFRRRLQLLFCFLLQLSMGSSLGIYSRLAAYELSPDFFLSSCLHLLTSVLTADCSSTVFTVDF